MNKSKLNKLLIEYINFLNLNILDLEDESYRLEIIDELHNKFFQQTYNKSDPFISIEIKENKKSIDKILDDKYIKFMTSCKKYLPKENILDSAIVEILSLLIKEINIEVEANKIYKTMNDFRTNLNKKDLTKRALSNLKCLGIADFIILNRNSTKYKIDFDKWFNEYNRYHIHNKRLLRIISPLLVSYLKSNRGIVLSDFFEIIDDILKEFISPIENSSSTFNIEYELLNRMGLDEKEIYIEVASDNLESEKKKIIPIKISINRDNSRTLHYNESNKENVIIEKNLEVKKIISIYDISNNLIAYNSFIYPNNKNLFEIVLECNTNLLEYFLYKPLQNQTIYSTQEQLLEFKEVYKYKVKDNKFYVVGNDTITNASSSVLKCLGEVKVLTPTSLTDFVSEKIQKHNSLSISS